MTGLLTVGSLLSPGALGDATALLEQVAWRDGRVTAGRRAARVKANEQADLSGSAGRALETRFRKAIAGHPVVQAAARPRRFSRLLVSRMAGQGHYGPHVDNAIMGSGEGALRTDLSFTLFLTPPDAYEGGELVLHMPGATQSLKGDPGDLVLYPTSEIHEVRPVTTGERTVCVGWIESRVPDPQQRGILFDLENLRVSLAAGLPEGSAERLTLDKTIANLLRMWARP